MAPIIIRGTGYHWPEGHAHHPLLGEYYSGCKEVVEAHIAWASEYGIDFFMVSWWGPHTPEEELFRRGLLKFGPLGLVKFAILYESVGRLRGLNRPEAVRRFLGDARYLALNYFGHRNYLRIEGRPVLFLYNVYYLYLTFRGDLAGPLRELRSELKALGYNVYLVGDVVAPVHPLPLSLLGIRVSLFDAVTSYLFLLSDNWHFVLKAAKRYYRIWRGYVREHGVAFILNVYPGFDKTGSKFYRGGPS